MSRKKKREERAIEDRREATKKICRVFEGKMCEYQSPGRPSCVPTPKHEKDAETRGGGRLTKVTMNQAAK